MTIKAIIWDMGGVILRMGDERPRQELADEFGLSLQQIYREIFDSPSAMQATIGEITTMQHWQIVGEHLGLSNYQTLPFFDRFWSVDEIDYALIKFIRQLRNDFKIGLLSNAGDHLGQLIKTTRDLASVFDDVIISAEVGLMKPDDQIYHLAISQLGIRPEEGLFIDDLFENVQAARRAGLKAILYHNNDEVFRILEQILAIENPEINLFRPGTTVLDALALIENQIKLEYSLSPESLLLPYPGSTEQALVVIYQYPGGVRYYLNQALTSSTRNALEALELSTAFDNPELISQIMREKHPHKSSDIYLSYFFPHSPSPEEFAQVTQNAGRFEIRVQDEPVSWAWSIRENESCAEVAVETLPEFRKFGYARQVTSAWAHHVISTGKLAFFSLLASNQVSRSLANSLGVIQFAKSITFE